jgi:hypothetical protein
MRSFLKEIADKFVEIESNACECGGHVVESICESCGTDYNTVDEQNVTGAIAGYNVPGAFTSEKNFKKKKFKYESVTESTPPVSRKHVLGHYQTIEFDEEVQNDKFPFSLDENDWWNNEMEYPSKDKTNTPGTAHKKDLHNKSIDELLDKKYEQLIEGYKDFKSGDVKPSSKVKSTIQEIAKKLQEIETLVNYNSKLKEESGVTSTAYGPGTQKALTKISERLIKISERIRSLGA